MVAIILAPHLVDLIVLDHVKVDVKLLAPEAVIKPAEITAVKIVVAVA